MKNIRFHSRHIPRELLNFETPVGVEVRNNGLCDTLETEMLNRLKAQGVETIETRLVWWELEPRPGQYDFTRFERDLGRIEQSGLKPGVFPWFQHPPAWYDPQHEKHVRFRCLEHEEDSTILSLWDPKTLDVYDRLYGELARRFGDRVQFLYAGISGDFGEVCYPSGVKHYHFSPPHNHTGFWCGDRLARAEFRRLMQAKYSTVENLNKAWSTKIASWDDDLMPALPMSGHALARRRDFADWYIDALMQFTDAASALIRRHFPNHDMAVPLGFPFEELWVGQIKSKAVKIAARHRMIARWTGMAFLKAFDRSNVLARRFASAAHFYGAPFAIEAALTLTKENAANGLYEALANGAMMVHDDPQNILRAEEIHRNLRPLLSVSPPVCRAAVIYPLANELYEIDGFRLDAFIDQAALLRRQADFDLCDEWMIRDGYLQQIDDLLVLVPTAIDEALLPHIEEFLRRGGKIWLCGDGSLSIINKQTVLKQPEWNAPGSVKQIAGFPPIAPFDRLRDGTSDVSFLTVHSDFISRYSPDACTIERLSLPVPTERTNI